MARQDPAITSFNAGELSPYMVGRPDMRRYANGCEHLLNMIPSVTGALRRRPGTIALQEPGSPGYAPGMLIPFLANSDTRSEFVLEVGRNYCHFWHAPTRKRINISGTTWTPFGGSTPANLPVPWTSIEDGNFDFQLQYAQSNDVMWLVHPEFPPVKIKRIGTYEFSWAYWGDGYNVPVPFNDIDPLNTITISASAATGVGITLTASSALFDAESISRGYYYIEQPAADSVKPWEAGKVVILGDIRRSDGRNYVALNGSTTGSVRPTHSTGAKYDGAAGVNWLFSDEGFGIVAVTAVTDSTHATATVIRQLPSTVVGAGTARWATSAWSNGQGWPTSIAFFRERLCFARGQTIWCSVAGDFENFTRTDGGIVTDDLAITLTIAANKNDRIKWLHPMGQLIAGTASGQFAIGELSTADPFSPSNVKAVPFGGFGSAKVAPLTIGETALFVQRGGAKVREIVYDFNIDALKSNDLTVDADHIVGRAAIRQMAHARSPDGVVWFINGSYQFFGLTYDRTQEVLAWHPHRLGGIDPVTGNKPGVLSLCSVMSPDGMNDDVWLLTYRWVAGVLSTRLEVIGPNEDLSFGGEWYYHEWPATQDSSYLDYYAKVIVGAGATSVSVPHIPNGDTVQGLLAGCVTADGVVSGGAYAIEPSASLRYGRVGYASESYVQPMPLTGGSATGAPQGKLSRVTSMVARVYKSGGFQYGKTWTDTNLDRVENRKQNNLMDTAVDLFTGDNFMRMPSGWDDRATVFIRQDQPLPLNLLALLPKLTIEDSR